AVGIRRTARPRITGFDARVPRLISAARERGGEGSPEVPLLRDEGSLERRASDVDQAPEPRLALHVPTLPEGGTHPGSVTCPAHPDDRRGAPAVHGDLRRGDGHHVDAGE